LDGAPDCEYRSAVQLPPPRPDHPPAPRGADRRRPPCDIEPGEYQRIKTILQLLGGTWSTRLQAFAFPADPTAVLTATIDAAAVPLHPDQATNFVRTPEYWAEVMCGYP